MLSLLWVGFSKCRIEVVASGNEFGGPRPRRIGDSDQGDLDKEKATREGGFFHELSA